MAQSYEYILAIWLRIEATCAPEELEKDLREYLEAKYFVKKLEAVDESDDDKEDIIDEVAISLQLQLTFKESEMDSDDPTDEALEEVDNQLRAYLEAKYEVNYMEILDDALTSFLLDVLEDDK